MNSSSSSETELSSSSSSEDFNEFIEHVGEFGILQPYQFEPQFPSSEDERSIAGSSDDEAVLEEEEEGLNRLTNSSW